jgi:hypothetical protein
MGPPGLYGVIRFGGVRPLGIQDKNSSPLPKGEYRYGSSVMDKNRIVMDQCVMVFRKKNIFRDLTHRLTYIIYSTVRSPLLYIPPTITILLSIYIKYLIICYR